MNLKLQWKNWTSVHRFYCKLFVIFAGICLVGRLVTLKHDTGFRIIRLAAQPNSSLQRSHEMNSERVERPPNVTIAEKDILKYLVEHTNGSQNLCSLIILQGAAPISYYHPEGDRVKWSQFSPLFAKLLGISAGGEWQPDDCVARFLVAIIIPLQNRESNLREFLLNMHPFLQRQNIHYKIYAIELASDKLWNKGILFNAGFVEAMKDKPYPCIILHDVDLLPMYQNNIYACTDGFRQMVVHRYKNLGKDRRQSFAWWNGFAWEGGAIALSSDRYRLLNGLSNRFFNWGREDEDFVRRAKYKRLQIMRYDESLSQYYQLPHRKSARNFTNDRTIKDGRLFYHEGLNTTKYTVIRRVDEPLCTRIVISY